MASEWLPSGKDMLRALSAGCQSLIIVPICGGLSRPIN